MILRACEVGSHLFAFFNSLVDPTPGLEKSLIESISLDDIDACADLDDTLLTNVHFGLCRFTLLSRLGIGLGLSHARGTARFIHQW